MNDDVAERSPRRFDVQTLRAAVARLLVQANYCIPDDVLEALRSSADREESPVGRRVLAQLISNYEVAASEKRPACQDSGLTVVHVELGQDVHCVGGDVYEAIYDGIRDGTRDGYLRQSVIGEPLLRRNSASDVPGVIHVDLVPGDRVTLTVASKGFGSENKSALAMLTPADGRKGVRDFVIATVDRAGADACPPLIVGVGVGGTFETAALLAKKAVLRPIARRHAQPHVRELEAELLEAINELGIGPQGLGGTVTALAVNIELHPTHIAGLPVAVNIGCHSNRRATATL
ncbi:MAG: fumarate hydratase [Acidobacteria bacterium]|nr:fumarate hydratase [Acidobacteriota bacterium]